MALEVMTVPGSVTIGSVVADVDFNVVYYIDSDGEPRVDKIEIDPDYELADYLSVDDMSEIEKSIQDKLGA